MTSLIVIGASAGGVQALQMVFENLPQNLSIPIVVVHHIPANSTIDYQLVYGHCCTYRIVEAHDKQKIHPGVIYFAPPDYHILIERDLRISLDHGEPVHFARPSIDVLFESAAVALGAKVCGILLTGANADGAEGLMAINKSGGITIVENPETAHASLMPKSALERFTPTKILDLPAIGSALPNIIQDVSL